MPYMQYMCIPSSEVMQLATGQSLTRWVGLLLLPTTTVNSYSVHGWRPLITYVSLVALDRVVPISLCPEDVFCKTVTISITCPPVRDVYVERNVKFAPVYQLQSFVCSVIWGVWFRPQLLAHLPHNSQTRAIDCLTHITRKACWNWEIYHNDTININLHHTRTNNYAHIPHRSGGVHT